MKKKVAKTKKSKKPAKKQECKKCLKLAGELKAVQSELYDRVDELRTKVSMWKSRAQTQHWTARRKNEESVLMHSMLQSAQALAARGKTTEHMLTVAINNILFLSGKPIAWCPMCGEAVIVSGGKPGMRVCSKCAKEITDYPWDRIYSYEFRGDCTDYKVNMMQVEASES